MFRSLQWVWQTNSKLGHADSDMTGGSYSELKVGEEQFDPTKCIGNQS